MHIQVYQTPLAAGLPIPSRAHLTDVGFDLQTAIDFSVGPGDPVRVPTGLVFDLPEKPFYIGGMFGFEGRIPFRIALIIEQRTGNGGRGLIPAATVVDPGYRPDHDDENGLTLLLRNIGRDILEFKRGDRVAQGLFIPMIAPELIGVPGKKVHWKTERGKKRFGDTGR